MYSLYIRGQWLKLDKDMAFLYLTNPGHSGDFELSTTGTFQCPFTEKEVNIMANVETFYKVHI